LQRALNQVSKVIQLAIGIAVARHFRDVVLGGLWIANDNRTPRVGMNVIFLQSLLYELTSIGADLIIRLRRRKIDAGTTSDRDRSSIMCEPISLGLRCQHQEWPVKYGR
jgi:hypothetical protein